MVNHDIFTGGKKIGHFFYFFFFILSSMVRTERPREQRSFYMLNVLFGRLSFNFVPLQLFKQFENYLAFRMDLHPSILLARRIASKLLSFCWSMEHPLRAKLRWDSKLSPAPILIRFDQWFPAWEFFFVRVSTLNPIYIADSRDIVLPAMVYKFYWLNLS